MDDDEIRDALGNTAPPPAPTADTLEAIMRRAQRGRARLLGVALVVALVAGPAAGVLIGLNLDDGGKPVTVASGATQNAPRRDTATAAPETANASGSASTAVGVVGGFGGEPKLEQLFVRTTPDGIAIRAYRADVPPPQVTKIDCPGNQPCPLPPEPAPPLPPEACLPSGILRAELSNQAAVEPGFLSVSTLAAGKAVVVSRAAYFGVAEGSPAAWAAVQVSDAVTTVRVHFGDGSVDEMAPVQGYAVLAHQIAPPAPPDPSADPEAFRKSLTPEGTVDALDGSGAVITSVSLADAGTAPSPECAVPVPPPAPVPSDQVPPSGGVSIAGATAPAPPAPAATTATTTR